MAIQLQLKIITGDMPGPHLLITGGVHGDEFEPMAAVRRLIARVTAEQLRGKLTLVPVVNESAYRRRHRCGDDDLDLARTCPGKVDGSVTQQVACAVSELIGQADYYIDLHTGGTTMAALPLAGYVLHADMKVLDAQRRMAGAFNLPIVWGTSSNLEGRTLSVARDCGVPAIYAEYLGAAVCDPKGVEAYVDGCLNVMGVLDMIERQQPAGCVEHVVEDVADGSGHMQVQNPSPMDGYFEPCVVLGQRVARGQKLGTVSDVLGEKVVDIVTCQGGLVLVIKTFPRVDEGEGLAVILPVDQV